MDKKYYEVTIQNNRINVKYFLATEKDIIIHMGKYYKNRIKDWHEISEEDITCRATFYKMETGKKMEIRELGD